MALDDARLARLLARERDSLLETCRLPTARQALQRARLHAPRRRAARISVLLDHLMLGASSLIAMVAVVATLLYVPLSYRVSIVVAGALGIGGVAVVAALLAIRTHLFEIRHPGERVEA